MKIKGLLTAVIAAALLLGGCSSSGKTALTVGNSAVSEGAVKFMCDYGGAGSAQDAADSLKQSYLVNAVSEAMNIEMSEEDEQTISDQVANIKAQIFGGYKAAEETLKDYGIGDDVLEQIFRASANAQQLMEQLETADPTDDEKKQYFKDNFMRAKHVLIMTTDQATGASLDDAKLAEAKTKADEVLAKAQAGEDFDALITQYNEDPGMASNADGYIFTEGDMVQEFEDMTKSLQPGEIGMCETSFGYHIIKRLALDETPELFDKFYNDNLSTIESVMESAKYDAALEAKAEEFGIKVEMNQDVIDALDAEDNAETDTESETETETE